MFGGGRGFPGGFFGGGMEREDEEETQQDVDNSTLYNIIGVPPQTKDTNEIKKAYRKACVRGDYRHPDKGGDPAKFKQLGEAYEILSNPEKKDLYDRGGMEAIKRDAQGGGGGGGFDDIFSFFGGGRGGQKRGPQKAKTKLKELDVTLEEVYKGKLVTFKHKRQRNCETCDGKGGANVKKCSTCKGKGVVVKMVQLGPGMYSQSQQHCPDCRGQGEVMDAKDKCKDCKGEKASMKVKTIEVALEPGVPQDHDILYTSEGDEAPGILAGDLVVRIKIEKHPVFVRKGADLFISKKISLIEALTGFNFEIKHLSGDKLTLATAPGEVLSHEVVKCVKGKGMPFFKDNYEHGNLYVKFQVEFPKRGDLKTDQIDALKKILPGPTHKTLSKKDQFEYLEEYDEHDDNPHPEGGQGKRRGQYDDDDDEDYQGGQRQNVQCANQ